TVENGAGVVAENILSVRNAQKDKREAAIRVEVRTEHAPIPPSAALMCLRVPKRQIQAVPCFCLSRGSDPFDFLDVSKICRHSRFDGVRGEFRRRRLFCWSTATSQHRQD